MFRKALVTLDRSVFSEAALPRVADVRPEQVLLLGVIESVAGILAREGPAVDVPSDIAERISRSEHDAVMQQLNAAAAQLRALGIAEVSTLTREGKPGPEIVRMAEEQGCDLIVMSTHGRSGIARAFLGSVANYVANHVEGCAVLLVRPEAAND